MPLPAPYLLPMRRFAQTACFDWSGQAVARPKGIALAICDAATPGAAPRLILRDDPWSRGEALDWLVQQAEVQADMLIGIDMSFGFPFLDAGGFFPGWAHSPANGPQMWALIDHLCRDDPHLGVASCLAHPHMREYFRHGGYLGTRYGPRPGGRLRVTELASQAAGLANPYSCLNLVGAAQVGKASLAGMRLLNRLRGRVPVWPFDPVPDSGPMLVEIHTTIAARHAGLRKGQSKIRDTAALNAALAHLGRPIADTPLPEPLPGPLTDHMADALITAAWLADAQARAHLWQPRPLVDDAHCITAATEGWTFGVF